MKRRLLSISVILLILTMPGILRAKSKNSKPGPLTGTWECTAHGGRNGDMQITLTLEQNKDVVTGSVTSPIGSSELNDATYEKKTLELHIESNPDEYILTGKLKGDKLSGEWTHGEERGAWEGSRQRPPASK